jgi:hypothetical protein
LFILNQCTGGRDGKQSVREILQELSYEEMAQLFESTKLSTFTLPIPRELHKMVNFIITHGKTKPNIFLTSGNLSQQRNIREKLDTNQPLNPSDDDVYTVAYTLLDFLHSLLSPILPIKIMNGIVKTYESQGSTQGDIMQQMVKQLPKENAQTFVYLVSFFREMLAYSEKNKLTPEKVSEIICECLVGVDRMDEKSIKSLFLQGDLYHRSDTMIFH